MLPQNGAGFKPQHAAQGAHTPSQSIPLYVPGRDKPVAFLCPCGHSYELRKGIQPHQILHKPPGAIAWAEEVLNEARGRGATQMRVTDLVTGTVYTCSFADFDRYRVPVNRGYGPQWALEPGRWSINGARPVLQAREEAQEAKSSQLSLFALEGAD